MTPSRGVKSNALGPDSPIPDKLYFKIGEVAKLVGVQAHVLRYWQSEIPAIRPSKSTSNQRRYRYKDVEIFREIRRLLYEERYTLAGARRRILTRETGPAAPGDLAEQADTAGDPAASAVAAASGVSASAAPAGSASSVPTVDVGVEAGTLGHRAAPLAPSAGPGAAPSVGAAAPAADGFPPAAPPSLDAPSRAPADVVPLPQRPVTPPPRSKPADDPSDDELVQRLRRGLKDLIRLAGEEP